MPRRVEIRLQIIPRIIARMLPKWILPVVAMPPIIDERMERIPIARIGEKSMFPTRNHPLLEKRFF